MTIWRLTRRATGLGAFAALVVCAFAGRAAAAEVQAAVAANFTAPAKEIAAAYEKASGNHVTLSFGSSGAFYSQIAHGAPFEVFLSADAERPEKVEKDGLGVAGTRFTYAVGKLVLYSTTPGLVDGRGAVLKGGRFAKLAIAEPTTAPYGAAAIETLQHLGVWSAVEPKIVKGSDITQAYQFTATGAADLGFVALSQVVAQPGGSRWIVPEALHAPIEQQAILLTPGKEDAAAKAFLAFLKGPQARAIIERYGYGVR
jgi:molybdate transport system substrate-binding protein